MEDGTKFAPPLPHSQIYHALVRAGTRIRPLQQVHARMVVSGVHCIRSLFTKLITLAGASTASNSGHYIRCLLHSAPNPDGFLFNTLIRVSSKSDRVSSADSIFFYRQMWSEGIQPSSYTFTAVLKACGDHSALRLGRLLHSQAVVNELDEDCYVQTALVAFYSKCGDVGIARMVFDRMRERSIVAWNSIISGYEQNGLADESVELFFEMNKMDSAPKADSATLVSLLSACSQLGRSDLGDWIRDYMSAKGIEPDAILGTSLINMYSRCSHVRKAREVFDNLKQRNVISWTAMISGYGMHGHGDEAMTLFHEMNSEGIRIRPNHVTFVAILSACGHAGLVNEGRRIFASMKQDHKVIPKMEHHVCMVDMLGRAGFLDEAIEFIKEHIPAGSAGPEVWTAMVGACKLHKNFKLGVEAAERLMCVEPNNPGHYVLLSNLYALAGMTDDVETVRNKMVRRRLKKQVGYSMIEIDEVGHVFRMGDRSHSQTRELYRCLDELMLKTCSAVSD